MNQTNKQVALVTGGAKRIGAAIVKQLHQAGFRVMIHCNHSIHEAKLLMKALNDKQENSANIIQKNLELSDSAEEIINTVISWAGRLDLLVNNASLFARTAEANWDTLFDVNVKAPFLLSYAARPHLAAKKGGIINLTDIHGKKPLKDYSIYCQTKAALAMQTKSLAIEFAPDLRVNAVAPGAIAWPEHNNELNDATKQQIINKTPLKRHGSPEFIAQAVLALAENPFITGQILNVDGGRSI